jgi:hypothetical protein
MAVDDKKFEQITRYLWKCPADFCLIYQAEEGRARPQLKLYEATSSAIPMDENCEKLAAKYRELATYCYEHKRNKLLRENMVSKGSPSAPWFGFKKPTGRDRIPVLTNSLGQRWWQLVIASGPTQKAGYVIVARVAAKTAREMRRHLAEIQCIVTEAGYFRRRLIILIALLSRAGPREKVA